MLMIVIIRCEECAVCPMPDSTGQTPSSRQITLIIARRAGLLGKKTEIFVYLTVRRILI